MLCSTYPCQQCLSNVNMMGGTSQPFFKSHVFSLIQFRFHVSMRGCLPRPSQIMLHHSAVDFIQSLHMLYYNCGKHPHVWVSLNISKALSIEFIGAFCETHQMKKYCLQSSVLYAAYVEPSVKTQKISLGTHLLKFESKSTISIHRNECDEYALRNTSANSPFCYSKYISHNMCFTLRQLLGNKNSLKVNISS